tara:strand:+ start:535 stop:792 length:258 start_codon:yes stop_codon:yes gene_type:complete
MSKKYDFKRGELITVNGEQGRINCINKEYFTLTIREWKDENKLGGLGQVNLLVYRSYWDDIVYHERENVEGNSYHSQQYRYEDVQ